MTKDVIVSIKGLQFENNDEPVELVTRGRYYNKNNKYNNNYFLLLCVYPFFRKLVLTFGVQIYIILI